MPEKVTYYAIVDSFSTRYRPAGILRRAETDSGRRDEVFGRNLAWGPAATRFSAVAGTGDRDPCSESGPDSSPGYELREISATEAGKIVTRMRQDAAATPLPDAGQRAGAPRCCLLGPGNLAGVNIWDTAAPDVLGEPFSAITLPVGSDFEGLVTATLVRSPAAVDAGNRGAVLYLPGYNDYFFQRHIAGFWNERGYDFYALDPRKSGRSCQPGQTRNLCRHLSDYFPEIDQAADVIRSSLGSSPGEGQSLLLSGHSTGGLIAAVWLGQRPGGADGLVLNGPFLTSPVPLFAQAVLNPALGCIADRWPTAAFPGQTASVYARGLHAEYGGEWMFDLSWKSASGTRLRLGWLAGVHEGQRAVRRGLGIGVPVLALFGERDIVMHVDLNAALTPRLGRDVTCERIDGAVHDVFLSERGAREDAFRVLGKWLESAGLP